MSCDSSSPASSHLPGRGDVDEMLLRFLSLFFFSPGGLGPSRSVASLHVSSLLGRIWLMRCETATVCPSRLDSGLPVARREKGEVERRRELAGAYLCPSQRSCFEFQAVSRLSFLLLPSHAYVGSRAWWAVGPATLPGNAEQILKASPLTRIPPGALLPPFCLVLSHHSVQHAGSWWQGKVPAQIPARETS